MCGVSCGKRLRRSWGWPYTCPRVYLLSPGPCLGPRQMLDRVGETASSLGPRVPRAPLNLPSTKKLKYFNIFFFLGARVYTLGAGVALCYIYIYNCVYIYIYIYIYYIFLVGFVFNSVVQNGGKPQSQRVSYLSARAWD